MRSKCKIAALILISFIFVLGCAGEKLPVSECKITDISFYPGIKSELKLKVGKSHSGYFKVTCDGEYELSDIIFSNSEPETVSFEYDKTVLDDYIYYKVKALSPGEAVISVKTPDATIQSEEIKIIVIEETTKIPETTGFCETPNARTYILNTSTKKYHIEGCSSVKRIKDINREIYEGTPDELELMGYTACKVCH